MGITLQGVLIKQKQPVAIKVGQMAADMLASAGLEQKISDPKNVEKLKPMIETHVDNFLRIKLKEQMPMISMFVGDKTINTLKLVFMQEIENLFPQVMAQFAGNLKSELNVEQIVVSKINNISPSELKALFYQNIGKDLRRLELAAVSLGFLMGILQLLIVFLTH